MDVDDTDWGYGAVVTVGRSAGWDMIVLYEALVMS